MGLLLFLVFAVLFPPYSICYVSVLYVASGGDIAVVPAGGGMGTLPPAPPAPPAYGTGELRYAAGLQHAARRLPPAATPGRRRPTRSPQRRRLLRRSRRRPSGSAGRGSPTRATAVTDGDAGRRARAARAAGSAGSARRRRLTAPL